jgi:hypothetical protein
MNSQRRKVIVSSSVPLGAKFIFRTLEILGSDYAVKRPPYEGQVLTVVGYKPRLKNNVVVHDRDGHEFLVPLDMVERALSLMALRV